VYKDIIFLLTAHAIADYGIQSAWVAEHKGKFLYIMLVHCMIWTGLVCIALQYIGILALWKFLFLFIGHFLMDNFKWKFIKNPGENKKWTYIDQGWHMIQLAIVLFIH